MGPPARVRAERLEDTADTFLRVGKLGEPVLALVAPEVHALKSEKGKF